MNIKEKILNDYVVSEAFSIRNKLLKNINNDLEDKIQLQYPKDKIEDLLNLRDELLAVSLQDFLEMEFTEELQSFI